LLNRGYCAVDSSVVPDSWITSRLNGSIIPFVEGTTRHSITGVKTITEYYSGNGTNMLNLSRRGVISLTQIAYVLGGDNQRVLSLANVELLADEGSIKAKRNAVETWMMPIFPKGQKNLKITYTAGYEPEDIPVDLCEAVKLLACDTILSFIEGMDGGGDVSVQAYNKSYGNRGKYSNIRNELQRMANAILRRYQTGVI